MEAKLFAWHKWAALHAAKLKEKGRNEANRELESGTAAIQKHKGARASQDLPHGQLPDIVRRAYEEPQRGVTTAAMCKLASILDRTQRRSRWVEPEYFPENLEAFKGKGIDLGERKGNQKIEVDAWSLVSCKAWEAVEKIPGFPTTAQDLENSKRYVMFERLMHMSATDAKNHLHPSAQWAIVGLDLMSVRAGSTTTFSLSSEHVIQS